MSKEPVIDSNININPASDVLHKRLLDISRVLNSGRGGPEVLVNGVDIPDQTFVDMEQGANIAIVVQPNKSIKISATGVGPGTVTEVDFTSLVSWLVAAITNPTTTPALTIDSEDGLAGNEVLATPNGSAGKLGVRALVQNDVPFTVPDTRLIDTTSPLTGGGDLSADRTLAVDTATVGGLGVVKPDGSTIIISAGEISAVATGFDPFTSLEFYDDFESLQGLSSGSNTWLSNYPWFRSGSDQEFADWSEPTFIGAVQIHSPAAGQEAMYLNSIAGPNFLTTWDDKVFDFKFAFKLSDATDNIAYNLGLADSGNPQFFHGITLHVDISSSPNFKFACVDAGGSTLTDSGVAADGNVHTMRIHADVAGTIKFSLDGAADVSINTHVPSTTLNPTFAVGTFGTTTIAHSCLLDYVWFKIAR